MHQHHPLTALRRALVPPAAAPLAGLPDGWEGAMLAERLGRTLLTAADVIDWYEDHHYWVWKETERAALPLLPAVLDRLFDTLVRPGPQHRHSLVTALVACPGRLDPHEGAAIRRFRRRRNYRLRLHGSATLRLLVVERESGTLHAGRDARALLQHITENKQRFFSGGIA